MEIIYLPKADEDLASWIKAGNKPVLKKIAQLTEAIIADPFGGIGKPEPLKFQLTGKWSRRITDEHRLVYKVLDQRIHIIQCRFHY